MADNTPAGGETTTSGTATAGSRERAPAPAQGPADAERGSRAPGTPDTAADETSSHGAAVDAGYARMGRQIERLIEVKASLDAVQEALPATGADAQTDARTGLHDLAGRVATARRELSELTIALRSDLADLRRAAGEPRSARAGIEIERKFLVKELPAALEGLPAEHISQGYIAIGEGGLEVRVRRRGDRTALAVKKGLGRARREEEVAIEPEQFQRLWRLTEGRRVEKARHVIATGGGPAIELDRYADGLDGLATAEVEFDSEAAADAFDPPDWFGPEVTEDPRYKNQRLASSGAPPPPRAAPEPFRLPRGEAVAAGIRRIARGQIDAAIDDLGVGALDDPGKAVHSCRKRFKRVRATVRLARDEIGEDACRQENAAFRDLGQRLSSARDSQVMIETLDALCAHYAFEIPSGAFVVLRAALVSEHQATERRLREGTAVGAPIIADLRVARIRVAAWGLGRDDETALAPGFERICRRARRAFRAARDDPSDETMHELRKRTKDLWHAAQILRRVAPKPMSTIAESAHRLSDLVGDDHDLAVLAQQIDRRPERFSDGREAALLNDLVARRRRKIQGQALELAQRIFTAKPAKLARRIETA